MIEMTSKLKLEKGGNNKKQKVKRIFDSAVHAKELKDHLPVFYYLVL